MAEFVLDLLEKAGAGVSRTSDLMAVTPNSFAAAASVAASRPVIATRGLSATKRHAVARPVPLFPPVKGSLALQQHRTQPLLVIMESPVAITQISNETICHVMAGALLEELSVAHIRFNSDAHTDATRVKANPLDDGIVDTLVSVGATSAFTLPFPATPRRARQSRLAARRHPVRRSPTQAGGPSLSLKVAGSVANHAFSAPGAGRTRPYSAMLCAGMSDR
jgi:hypothetical protein